MSEKPQVEIVGWEAKNYDNFLNFISFGKYERFIQKVIHDLDIYEDDIIMDLGAGTGKNADLMLRYMQNEGSVYALEIGDEMRKQLSVRHKNDSRIHILNQRIELPFRLPEKATLAFISFVLHGLEQQNRLQVVRNVSENLVSSGRFCILDYNHFSVQGSPWYIRFGVRTIECKPTEDFINRDWLEILSQNGFGDFSKKYYFKNYLRLLCCRKNS